MAINPRPLAPTPSPPSITISTDLSAMVNASQQALLSMPKAPLVFQRARQLCLIAYGIKPPKWLQRPADAPVIVPLDREYLVELLTQAADWQKYNKRTDEHEAAMPPAQVVKTLLARPFQPFPLLEGILSAPTLRPDGSILDRPGYDQDTALWLDANGTAYPKMPPKPSLDQARSAIGRLQEAFTDFPFTHTHHFSAAIAAVLTLVARYTFQGNVPLFGVSATTRASGKGLLVDAIATIGTGRTAPHWPQTTEEEEERKRVLTLALDGDPLVLIDNVTQPLGSAPLDAALTAQTFKDRILGKTQSREAPMNAVFFATGNNMAYQGDMARRVLPIDLDPRMERPEERTGFQHAPLLPWVRQHRSVLVIAALTILKAYFSAGCPSQGFTQLGSFEAWSDLIRGALVWAGEADPCEGRKSIEAENDPQYEALDILLDTWEQCYGVQAKTLNHVLQDISLYTQDTAAPPDKWDDLQEALGAMDPRYDSKRLNTRLLGEAFSRYQGRTIDGRRFIRNGFDHKVALWKIEIL